MLTDPLLIPACTLATLPAKRCVLVHSAWPSSQADLCRRHALRVSHRRQFCPCRRTLERLGPAFINGTNGQPQGVTCSLLTCARSWSAFTVRHHYTRCTSPSQPSQRLALGVCMSCLSSLMSSLWQVAALHRCTRLVSVTKGHCILGCIQASLRI